MTNEGPYANSTQDMFITHISCSVCIKTMFQNEKIKDNNFKRKKLSYFGFDLPNEGKSNDASIYFRYFATDLIRTQFQELQKSTCRTFCKTKFLRMSHKLRGIEIRLYIHYCTK